jgi:hypothetical protein
MSADSCTNTVPMAAETMRCWVLPACAKAFLMQCTRQRCQVALKTLATAALMPSWLSLMTSLTPREPRRFRLLRNSVQSGSASECPTYSTINGRKRSTDARYR